MRSDPIHLFGMNEGKQPAAPQSVPHTSSSSVSQTGESALGTLRVSELAEQCLREINAYRRGEVSTEVSGIELLRRATVHGDQEAWASWQQCLAEVVRGWLRRHPSGRWQLAWTAKRTMWPRPLRGSGGPPRRISKWNSAR